MKRISAVLVTCVLLLIPAALAEEAQMPTPQPTEQHEVLEMWVGKWSGEAEMKPSPFGPGGPMKWTEDCSWFGGVGFHVVCTSEGSGPMGDMQGLGIITYNPEKGVYTHYGIDSAGWTGHSEGSLEGDTWSFQSKESMGGQEFYSRFSMTEVSPGVMTFVWQTSEDGETWVTLMEGTNRKAN